MVKPPTPKQKDPLKKSGPLKRKQTGTLKAKGVSPKAKKMISPAAMKTGAVMSKKADSSAVKKLNTPKAKKTESPAAKKTQSSVVKQKNSQAVKKVVKKLSSSAVKNTGTSVVKKKMAKKGKIKIQTGFPLVKKVGNSVVKKPGSPRVKKRSLATKKKASTKFLALKKTNDKRFRRRAVLRRQAFKKAGEVKKRGVVVLSNIPHGFFEGEMERYFRQFGVIDNLRLVRSRRTGQSCGYAFVEFQHYEVAKIVAKYMDGYLTFGKIMKCKILPPEVVTDRLFRGKEIRPDNCPKLNRRKGAINKLNKNRTEEQIQRREARLTATYIKKVKKLQELGVDISLETLIGKALPQEEKQDEGDTTQLTNGHVTPKDTTLDPKEEDEAELSLLEDTSDVEPSKDIDPDLTEGQKVELSAQKKELAALIKSHLESPKKKKLKKTKAANKTQDTTNAEIIMIEVDESEDEVVLKTPPNAVKKYVKMGSKSTPATTPKTKKPTPKGENRTPKVKKMTTPKAKKIKLTPQGENQPPKGTKKALNEENTPKAKKIKMSPKGETSSTKLTQNTPKEISATEEPSIATPRPKTETLEPKLTTLKSGKATPKSEKKAGVLNTKKATPKSEGLPDTPLTEELEPVDSLPTPKIKKQKLKAKESLDDIQVTPINKEVQLHTDSLTPKSGKKTPLNKTKTPKMKKTPAGEAQQTPKINTHKASKIIPRLDMFDSEEISIIEVLPMSRSKGKTPKAKNQTPVTQNLPKDTHTGKKKTPKLKKLGTAGENKEYTENSTPKGKSRLTLTPTPSVTTEAALENTATVEATPGRKKKANQTPAQTPPSKRKQNVTPLNEPTSGKKKMNKVTPGKDLPVVTQEAVVTPAVKAPVEGVTTTPNPKKTPLKTTPGKKTPKVKPTKRKSMLTYPDGKSPSKKQKGRLSLG